MALELLTAAQTGAGMETFLTALHELEELSDAKLVVAETVSMFGRAMIIYERETGHDRAQVMRAIGETMTGPFDQE